MAISELEYRDPEGKRFVGHLARPERGHGASVLIAHAAPGVSDHERAVAQRLADAGYIALVADYHGDGETIPRDVLMQRIGPLMADPALVRGPMRAALAALVAQPGVDSARVGVIGYCFGGCAALELARSGADVRAVVGFHANLPTNRPEDAKNIKGSVLVLNGAADPIVPRDMRAAFEDQMNAAGVDWRMVLFGGAQHAFTLVGAENFGMPGIAYHKAADERSWRAMLDLFEEGIARR